MRILKTFNEMYGLFFKGAQNLRTKNMFNPYLKGGTNNESGNFLDD